MPISASLANARTEGLDLLTRMADAAAVQAGARLLRPVRLARCEALELSEDCAAIDLSLESWPVRADEQTITVSVFATTHQADGGERMAGTGRFTFTTLNSLTKEYHA